MPGLVGLACTSVVALLLRAQPLSSVDSNVDNVCAPGDPPKDISGDSGVLKRVLRAGRGPAPEAGQWLRARYVGTLENGVVFDQSAPDAPIGFTLGRRARHARASPAHRWPA